MYNGLKRVFEGGLQRGSPRALKLAVGEDTVALKIRKQRLMSAYDLSFGPATLEVTR